MKFVFILSCLFLTAVSSYAQFSNEKLFYAQKSEKYKRMKGTGTLLTVLGGVAFVAGIATLSNSSITYTSNGYGQQTQQTTGNPGAGAVELLLGMGGLGAGIPIWIVGSHNYKKYENKLNSVTLNFKVSPNKAGIILAYRF